MRRLIVFGVLLSAMAAAPPHAAAQAYASASERGTNPQRTAAVQQRLQALGHYRGRVDGRWGRRTTEALSRFQRDNRLRVTGRLNEATAHALGLGRRPVRASAAPTGARGVAVQRRLKPLGFYAGPVDGMWGPGTRGAAMRFERTRGLTETGTRSRPTLAALGFNPDGVARPDERRFSGSSTP